MAGNQNGIIAGGNVNIFNSPYFTPKQRTDVTIYLFF